MAIDYVADPLGRKHEVREIAWMHFSKAAELRAELERWSAKCKDDNAHLAAGLETKLDAAFDLLAHLTQQILETSDDHILSPETCLTTGLLPAVRETKASFEALLAATQDELDALGKETEQAFDEEGAIFKMLQTLENHQKETRAEFEAVVLLTNRYWDEYCDAELMHENAARRLQEKEAGCDGFFFELFNDKEGILNPFRQDCRYQYARREQNHAKHRDMQELAEQQHEILQQLDSHIQQLQDAMLETAAEEHKIIDAKIAMSDVCSKIWDMEICFESRAIEADRMDCLRHILCLLEIRVGLVDDDMHVREAKARIHGHLLEHFSEEQVQQLIHTQKYIDTDV